MIHFTQYLTEDKEGKNFHLDRLEDEIINGGVHGVRSAIDLLQSKVKIAMLSDEETKEVMKILAQAESLFRTISPRTLNMIASNITYKDQIRTWNNSKVTDGQMITNTTTHVAGLIAYVEEKTNRKILDAKKADTRLKRQKEKKMVIDFYKSNRNELKKIFDLQNLLIRAKSIIVRKSVKDL